MIDLNNKMKLKILLIHGWNYANYTSSGCRDAWGNRSRFVTDLAKHFKVVSFNLPGFCGEKDPSISWNLDDFASFVGQKIQREKPDYVLGYSFGGAIALRWKKTTSDTRIKVILVSPAIIRKHKKLNLNIVQKILKIALPEKIISILRNLYLTKVIKNPYYTNANSVMRRTYRNIVALDLRNDLVSVSDSISLIYGENDTATPPALIKSVLEECGIINSLHIISSGGHDIANTHTEELISAILKIKEEKNEDQFESHKKDFA